MAEVQAPEIHEIADTRRDRAKQIVREVERRKLWGGGISRDRSEFVAREVEGSEGRGPLV